MLRRCEVSVFGPGRLLMSGVLSTSMPSAQRARGHRVKAGFRIRGSGGSAGAWPWASAASVLRSSSGCSSRGSSAGAPNSGSSRIRKPWPPGPQRKGEEAENALRSAEVTLRESAYPRASDTCSQLRPPLSVFLRSGGDCLGSDGRGL